MEKTNSLSVDFAKYSFCFAGYVVGFNVKLPLSEFRNGFSFQVATK